MKRLVVETDSLIYNIERIKELTASKIYGVVKGNGYGLGLVPFARCLVENGAEALAVTEPGDAVCLREEGFSDIPILLMRATTDRTELELIIKYGLTATVASPATAEALQTFCAEENRRAQAQVKIDTGMGRFGFALTDIDLIFDTLSACPALDFCGIYSHFHSAFGKKKSVDKQLELFLSVTDALAGRGLVLGERHIANSTAALLYPETRLDAVRIGSAFLGRLPVQDTMGLKKVGYLETAILDTRLLKKGATSGYAATFKAKKPVHIGVIPVGYQDGFSVSKNPELFSFVALMRVCWQELRRFFRGARMPHVFINGKRYQTIGRIGVVSSVVAVDQTVLPGTAVRIDINPLFVDSAVERYYA